MTLAAILTRLLIAAGIAAIYVWYAKSEEKPMQDIKRYGTRIFLISFILLTAVLELRLIWLA